ncbi:MAG TPA: hypothetical protein PK198_18765, partial [Saprospiraceae bacterium]|nr:hypothetical protein [Saprospiraceae bacterium]
LDWAPGFVSIAVVPDLTKLKPGQDLEPRAPVSLLEEIKAYLKTKISPFVRLKIMNPRYEKVNLNVRVRLRKGKDKTFYAARLKEDLTNLLAPWYITRDSDKLVFGQAVSESEVIRYIESLDYVDFITCLSLSGDEDAPSLLRAIGPVTARSILTAGEICVVVDEDDCARYSDTQPDCFAEAGNEFPFHQICKTPAPPPEEEYGP